MDQDRGTAPETRGVGRFALRVIVALAIVAIAALIWFLHDLLLLLFAAVLVAVILTAAAEGLCRWVPLPRWAALAIATLGILGTIAGVVTLFGAQVNQQTSELLDRLPGAIEQARGLIGSDRVDDIMEGITPASSDMLTIVQTVVGAITSIFSGLMLAVLGGIYLAANPGMYRRGLIRLFPNNSRDAVEDGLSTAGGSLRNWILGQLALMVIVGVATFIGLTIAGVPSPLALALIAGLAEFVPLLGPILAAIPGILIALTVSPETALYALGVYLVIQQMEGNVLNPLVMKHAVDLPPALTLFGLFLSGALFGIVGVVLGGPIIVVAFVLVKRLWVERMLGDEGEAEA